MRLWHIYLETSRSRFLSSLSAAEAMTSQGRTREGAGLNQI
jgi:hypothetical protein